MSDYLSTSSNFYGSSSRRPPQRGKPLGTVLTLRRNTSSLRRRSSLALAKLLVAFSSPFGAAGQGLCNICKTSIYDASCFYELIDPLFMYQARVFDWDSEMTRKKDCCGKAEEWIHCMQFNCNTNALDKKVLEILKASCGSFNTKWMLTNLDDMRDWVIWELDFLELKRDHIAKNSSICDASEVISLNNTLAPTNYEALMSNNGSLLSLEGMFAEMTAFGYSVLAILDKDITTEWASYCGINGCKARQASFGQVSVKECGKTSQFVSFAPCDPGSVYLPHPTSYSVKGYLSHHGSQRTVACKAGLSTDGLYAGAQVTCVSGTWTVGYPACPLESMALRLVIPTSAKALEQQVSLMDIWLFGDRKCTQPIQLPRSNLTFFVTPGFNDTIANVSHVWDSTMATFWAPDWPNLVERLNGVSLYAGAVSSTKAIDWACLEFWYKGNRNWEELTWRVEMWDGAQWAVRAEITDATGGSQKTRILQDACEPLSRTLDKQFTIADGANNQNIVGVRVRIVCTQDYSPVTLPGGTVRVDQILTCEPNLLWSPIRLKCLAACDKFYPVGPNFQVFGTGYLHGATRTVNCAENYEAFEENAIVPQTVRCSSGVWELPFFTCRWVMPSTTPPPNPASRRYYSRLHLELSTLAEGLGSITVLLVLLLLFF